jgi:hypothetical protein
MSLQAHGSADQVVDHSWGKSSHMLLKTMISDPEPTYMTIKVISSIFFPQV